MWSLGVSLLEVANNRFPFPPEGEPPLVGQFDLLNFIVNQPTPQLVDDDRAEWTDSAKDFVRRWSVSLTVPSDRDPERSLCFYSAAVVLQSGALRRDATLPTRSHPPSVHQDVRAQEGGPRKVDRHGLAMELDVHLPLPSPLASARRPCMVQIVTSPLRLFLSHLSHALSPHAFASKVH